MSSATGIPVPMIEGFFERPDKRKDNVVFTNVPFTHNIAHNSDTLYTVHRMMSNYTKVYTIILEQAYA